MNATPAMALIAVSLTALGMAFFLWTQASGNQRASREGESTESPEQDSTEGSVEEPDG